MGGKTCGGQWDPSADESPVSDKDTATAGFNEIPSVRANVGDDAIDVPLFGLVILYCDV